MFRYLGERLCLDFVNTELVDQGERADRLGSFDDLVAWSQGAGVVDAGQARDLRARWSGKAEGERTLKAAVGFRAALRDMTARLASGQMRAPQAALDAVNDALGVRAGDPVVVRTAKGYERAWRDRFSHPSHLLVPVAESAVDLLVEGDLSLLKKCQNPECVLYFYDTTRNHARRWCSMTACGNRAKVAAHYRRTRGADAGA